jgi:uncharacterized protein YbjT (DUF2867 family)
MGTNESTPARTVLVVGANGFLGGYVAAALHRQGWRVLRGVRPNGRIADDERPCDFARMQSPEDWREVLTGVDAVVNAAGILRERADQTFEDVHVAGPLALARACVSHGITAFVQLSALGVPADGDFIASKHRFDAALLALPLQAAVLRPSVVYAAAGSYGGTSLLRALAGFPGFQWLPGDGRWRLQPVAAEDLADVVAACLARGTHGVFEVGGPAPLSLRTYQAMWRRWLRIPGDWVAVVPEPLVSLQVAVWERLGRGPVGTTMWRMLRRGNVTMPDAARRLEEACGVRPRALDEVLAAHPSQAQDRWHAQLYFLASVLRGAVVLVWLLSAWAGWRVAPVTVARLLDGAPWLSAAPIILARGGAALDAALALWLASGWRPRLALGAMGLSVLAYTILLGVLAPALWFEPLGGLAKNLLVLPALAVLWILVDRR